VLKHVSEHNLGWPVLQHVLHGHSDAVSSVAFSPNGKHIVSGSFDKTIQLWDAETGEMLRPPLEGHEGHVRAVTFSPDGKHIVSGSDDKTIRLWDAEAGEMLQPPLEGHEIGSGLLHSHQMAGTLCQGQMTRPFDCGMLKQERCCNLLLRAMRIGSWLLHFHQMASTLCQGHLTRPFDCGMLEQERCCNLLLRVMRLGQGCCIFTRWQAHCVRVR
jgi:hypothetical protein